MTREDRETERQENEALKSAKEIVKKKTKNKVQKIIWNAIKAAIIPMLILMAKIMAVTILVCVVISLFQSILDGDADTDKEELLDTEYSVSSEDDYIVCIGQENALPALTEEQLKTAIESKYVGQAKENYLGVIDDLIYIQEEYNVNAVFAIAVAQQESSGGINWGAISPETHNWMSMTGSYNGQSYRNPNSQNPRTWRVYDSFSIATRDFGDIIANGSRYFKAGKYTVSSIAKVYDEPGDTWAQAVKNIMKDIYAKAGIEITSGSQTGETGYDSEEGVSTFTVGSRTYKNYKQITPSYKSIPLANYQGESLYSARVCYSICFNNSNRFW